MMRRAKVLRMRKRKVARVSDSTALRNVPSLKSHKMALKPRKSHAAQNHMLLHGETCRKLSNVTIVEKKRFRNSAQVHVRPF